MQDDPSAWEVWKARRPDFAHRERFGANLIARVLAYRRGDWPRGGGWRVDDATGVALLIRDHGLLADVGETEQGALKLWAYMLWGIDGGDHDLATRLIATRTWFTEQRLRLAIESEMRS